jgi:hypothetical protein
VFRSEHPVNKPPLPIQIARYMNDPCGARCLESLRVL